MATAYTEFDSVPSTVIADIKAKILLSGDWANPIGNVVSATCDNGAQMVVDLADAAVTNFGMTVGVYRSHNGTTGTDKIQRFPVWHRNGVTAAATDLIHVVVSAGKNHLYVSVEGPRGGEANADNVTTGSPKTYLILGQITPYYDGTLDPVPCVGLVGPNTLVTSTQETVGYVSRNAANTVSWVPAAMETVMGFVRGGVASRQGGRVGLDGNTHLRPWVFNELSGGDRGRWTDIYYAGLPYSVLYATSDPYLAPGQRVTFGGKTFTLQVGRGFMSSGHFGFTGFGPGATQITVPDGPLIAVPSA